MFPVTNFEFMFWCDSFLKSYKKNNCQPLRTFRNYGRTFPFLQTRNSAFLLLYRYLCFDTRKPFICIALPSCLLCTTHICAVKGTSVRPKSKQPSSWTLLTHPNIKIFFKFFDLKALVFFFCSGHRAIIFFILTGTGVYTYSEIYTYSLAFNPHTNQII